MVRNTYTGDARKSTPKGNLCNDSENQHAPKRHFKGQHPAYLRAFRLRFAWSALPGSRIRAQATESHRAGAPASRPLDWRHFQQKQADQGNSGAKASTILLERSWKDSATEGG